MSGLPDITDILPPRISELGNTVISEIAERLGVKKKCVLRAMLLVSLAHQSELLEHVEKLRAHEDELDEYQ